MRIYIVRHGETEMNTKGLLQGRLDEPLNRNGRDLAILTGRAIKGFHFDVCISSPLSRALETAEIILRESGNDIPISTDERAIEMNFGDLEGGKISQMGVAGELFATDPFHFIGFPHGETFMDVCERTQDLLKELIKKDDGKTYLISTHGCALRGMINFLFEDSSDYWRGHVPYNCSFTIIDAKGGRAVITDLDKVYYDEKLIVDHFRH